MTAVTGLALLLGTLVFAFMVASSYGTGTRLSVTLVASGFAGGMVTFLVVAAGMLVLGEPS